MQSMTKKKEGFVETLDEDTLSVSKMGGGITCCSCCCCCFIMMMVIAYFAYQQGKKSF
jgi:hypothetical protein